MPKFKQRADQLMAADPYTKEKRLWSEIWEESSEYVNLDVALGFLSANDFICMTRPTFYKKCYEYKLDQTYDVLVDNGKGRKRRRFSKKALEDFVRDTEKYKRTMDERKELEASDWTP